MSLIRLPFARVGLARYPASSLDRRPADGTRGPELLTLPFTSWTTGGTNPPTVDSTGIQFTNAPTSAIAHLDGIATKDNTLYEATFEITGRSGGDITPRAYGPTSGHTGVGTQANANGIWKMQFTTNSAGSPTSQFRFTSSSASTTLKVISASLREVLVPGT